MLRQLSLLCFGACCVLATLVTANAQQATSPTSPHPRKEINLRPFHDLWSRLTQQEEINWTADTEVTIEGERDSGNRLKNLRLVNYIGDKALAHFWAEFVAAIGDSQLLQFAPREASVWRFNISSKSNSFAARAEAQMPSPEEAEAMARAYSTMLLAARLKKKGEPETIYFEAAKIGSSGNNLTLDFTMPREKVIKLIKAQLEIAGQKK